VSDLLQILGLAILSMANPTLLAAVTLMLLLPSPRRLMLGYLLGAYLTSISCGIVILYALQGSSAVETGKQAISPAQDIVVGLLLIVVAVALGEGRGKELRERRAARRASSEKEKKDPLPMRMLGRGSARVAFAVGVVLSFPGASYLVGLTHIDKLEAAVVPSVLLVAGFCLFQLLLLELPLVGYFVAPERTATAVASFRSWLARNGRRTGARFAAVLGGLLILRALIVLLA
jgi:Sap-like sulfolipid-1-addressing protein